jgi:flagellar basal-body rod protein FlgF
MPGGQYIALSGMRSRMGDLDRLAEDIANVNTTGYKAERTAREHVNRPTFDASLQTAIDVVQGGRRIDMSTGAITPTGRDLDVAIEGPGFFTVQSPAGTRYTRAGHFLRGADGTLNAADGSPVLAQGDNTIKVGTTKVTVDGDGTVHSNGAVVGKLQITEFPDPGQLVREGGAMMSAGTQVPAEAEQVGVRSGALEQSNVSVVARIAELTDVARGFDALQRAVSILMNDIDGKAIDHLGRR